MSATTSRPELHLIAHDIRSRENVGSLFRSCDSLGVAKLWLSGYTICPPDAQLSKVALGAESVVPWEKRLDGVSLLQELRKSGVPIYALELTPEAIELARFTPPARMALLLGSERTGVSPTLLELCEGVIKITQQGIKESMNVSVSAAIAAWAILR